MKPDSGQPTPDSTTKSSERIQAFLDSPSASSETQDWQGPEKRKHPRFPHWVDSGFEVVFSRADGDTQICMAIPRNISKGGIAFLIEEPIAVNTHCMVRLLDADGGWHQVPGRVVRTRPVQDSIHEIGVQFDEGLDLATIGLPNEPKQA